MSAPSFENIIRDLKSGNFQPVYFLSGDEPYFIDLIADFIEEHALNETEKTFNQTILYGRDATPSMVIDAARRFPMMSNRQVVILREAQDMEKIDDLVHYMEKPQKTTILVIAYKYKSPDKRRKIFKSLQKHALCFESKKLYDDKLPGWINSHVSSLGHTIDPKAAVMLAEFLGSDLSRIANEVDKLILSMQDGERAITPALIERNIGISKDFNNFELQNALGRKDVLKANRIVVYFAGNQKNYPLVVTISSLYYFFSKVLIYYWIKDKSKENVASVLKINPYFVKEYAGAAGKYNPDKVISIIRLLREYDLKAKGFGGQVIPPGELLKELIYKIIH